MMLSSNYNRALGLIFALVFVVATPARVLADLVWDAQNGWRIQGGALASSVENPGEERNAVTLMNKARAAEEKGNLRTALSAYKKVAKKYSSSVYAPEALYRIGQVYTQRRQYTKAYASYQEIIEKYPAYEHFKETIGGEFKVGDLMVKGARVRLFGIIPTFKNTDKGIEILEKVVKNAPYSEYAPLSLMTIAHGYTKKGDSDGAIDALDRMINDYPDSFLASDAYLKLAQTHSDLVAGPYYDQGATLQAITYFQDFLILYPKDPNVSVASQGLDSSKTVLARSKMLMGDFYNKYRHNKTAARVFYNEAITIYPDSKVADLAKEKIATLDQTPKGTTSDVEDNNTAPVAPPARKRFWLF